MFTHFSEYAYTFVNTLVSLPLLNVSRAECVDLLVTCFACNVLMNFRRGDPFQRKIFIAFIFLKRIWTKWRVMKAAGSPDRFRFGRGYPASKLVNIRKFTVCNSKKISSDKCVRIFRINVANLLPRNTDPRLPHRIVIDPSPILPYHLCCFTLVTCLVYQRLECLVKMGPNWSIGQWFHVFIGLRLRTRVRWRYELA